MADPAAPVSGDDESASGTPGSRVFGWLVALLATAIALVLFMHVYAPPIAPDDVAPEVHPQSLCVGCHIVMDSKGR